MFDLNRELSQWRKPFEKKFLKKDLDELESHIIDLFDELRETSASETDAFEAAIIQLGSVDAILKEFSKVQSLSFSTNKITAFGVPLILVTLIILGAVTFNFFKYFLYQ